MFFENSFTSSSGEKFISPIIRQPRKGVIVGAGQVGMACAYSLLIQNILDEIVIVDIRLSMARPLNSIAKVSAGWRCGGW